MEEKCQIFVKESNNNKKYALNCIIRFLQKQKARVERMEITGATVRNYVKTIKLFCEMNEISIPWKRLPKVFLKQGIMQITDTNNRRSSENN